MHKCYVIYLDAKLRWNLHTLTHSTSLLHLPLFHPGILWWCPHHLRVKHHFSISGRVAAPLSKIRIIFPQSIRYSKASPQERAKEGGWQKTPQNTTLVWGRQRKDDVTGPWGVRRKWKSIQIHIWIRLALMNPLRISPAGSDIANILMRKSKMNANLCLQSAYNVKRFLYYLL